MSEEIKSTENTENKEKTSEASTEAKVIKRAVPGTGDRPARTGDRPPRTGGPRRNYGDRKRFFYTKKVI